MLNVYQIGPDESRPGGIRTVMKTLQNSTLSDTYGMKVISTASARHRIWTFLRGFGQIRQVIHYERDACFHLHMSENASVFRAAILIDWIKGHSASRVIVHSHGSSIQKFMEGLNERKRSRLLKSLGKADCIVVLTPGWKEWWSSYLPEMRFEIIPNSVQVPEFEDMHSGAQRSECPQILFLGELGERKGTYLLLKAANRVLKARPSAKFVFAGNGEVDECGRFAYGLGISDSCVFTGWADSTLKEELLEQSWVLALPSKEESFGIVLLEAMAHGIPVICSDGGYMHEVVEDGVDGIVFPTGEEGKLAEAILRLIEDSAVAEAMGAEGYRKVRSSYSNAVVLHTWANLYSEMCL